jgi:hypothetical protein
MSSRLHLGDKLKSLYHQFAHWADAAMPLSHQTTSDIYPQKPVREAYSADGEGAVPR